MGTLMVTAEINVLNQSQVPIKCRTLIDTCSNSNFITERFATKLFLERKRCSVPIGALNGMSTTSNNMITAVIQSRTCGFNRSVTFLVVPTIAKSVPLEPVRRNLIKIPKNIVLADSEFYKPAPVDMLLGTGISLSILCVGQINLSAENGPELYLQKTQFGWVIGGSAPTTQLPLSRNCYYTNDINFDLTKFWELEENEPKGSFTKEEIECEEHFKINVTRNQDGRFCVALPFNNKNLKLGESLTMARKRLKGLTSKLLSNPETKKKYEDVIQEYLDLGHMSPVKEENQNETGFYLPHHAVMKPNSLTTALRVVFDGSAKSSSGISLNETLMVGPTIQTELLMLLLRFRKYAIVLTGDIEKMYRQFLIRPEDRKYQRILWYNSNGEEQSYELNTITFGLAPSPYLAIRCLHQLAQEEEHNYPEASRVIKNDLYVDDALTGGNTLEEVVNLRNQLSNLLEKGCLKMRQWASNDARVLEGVPKENINQHLLLQDSPFIKTLGLKWNSSNDTITYIVNSLPENIPITKRTIISETARIFDPLGLLSPVIITAKIIFQKLWTLKLDWDESLPNALHTEWSQFRMQFPQLNNVEFHRKVIIENYTNIELHGFCDASERAYGACVYVRSRDNLGQIHVALLCAKSRVAPIKPTTIPRLELCGALLLANLVTYVKKSLQLRMDRVICWSDSTIVLHWLQTPAQTLKVFVANRVAEIQAKIDINSWQHIRTHENPADLVSRGLSPTDLVKASLWIQGPSWLSQKEIDWPKPVIISLTQEIPETKTVQCFHIDVTSDNLLTKYSSIHKMETIFAYCMRFTPNNKIRGPITLKERHIAHNIIIRLLQKTAFPEELHCLRNNKPINNKSNLLPLNPFIDKSDILRVGGRLRHSFMPFSQKHPMIIPKSHHITKLLIETEHKINLHAGVQATLYALRRRYWIIDGRNQVRQVLRTCITCSKLQPPSLNYLMGDLPSDRVTPSRPFSKVGIDYCGPFFIKEKRHRNTKRIKAYIAVFVCLSVKAVHLEVVHDLTTDAFLAAFRRFISRRGICSDVYTDNGTNFIGGRNDIKELYAVLNNDEHKLRVNNFTNERNIRWHFIPARAPNFGGLWEAAVKSFKHHLRRTIGATLLTYEDMNTLVIEIEAILNSRPLTPISSDPNDLVVLTPGHFLIGDSMTSLPEQSVSQIPSNRLSNWQHLQKMRQHFWSRWSNEYLNELTVRHKWTKVQPSIQEGTIVLLKEDNIPPLQWNMGRVIQTYPGADGIVRVVKVKTVKGTFDRSVRKIAPLPIEH